MINKNLSNKVRFYGKIARIAAIVMMISVFTVSCGKGGKSASGQGTNYRRKFNVVRIHSQWNYKGN